MTAATIVFILLGKKITLRERLVIQEALNQLSLQGVVRLVYIIVFMTLAIEVVGVLILSFRFIPLYGFATGIFYAAFHAVSAFCNAGFDLIGGYRSLTPFALDFFVSGTVAILFILGGLGFTVLLEVYQRRRVARLTLHAKMVLSITLILLATGTLVVLALEYNNPNTLGQFGFWGKLLNAFFTAATPRTAGFNTIPTDGLIQPTLFFLLALMFIGASPGSTGGGIKTTTFGSLLITVFSTVHGDEEPVLFKRRLPVEIVNKALTVVFISFLLVFFATLALSLTEQRPLMDVFFEAVSAFGTVGLSTGITPQLSQLGRIVVILTMFAGRVGPLTLVFAFAQRAHKRPVHYTSERILIG
jgi:trk system potassium uptake protein TrkH